MLSAAARTNDLLVERPADLPASRRRARDDQQVRPRNPAAFGQRVEAADRGRDLLGRTLALHLHRPHQHAARKAVLKRCRMSRMTAPVGEVTTPITSGSHGSNCLRASSNRPFGGELLLALLHQRHQRADPGRARAPRSRSGISTSRDRS
jgi:hypothetical protein